MGGRYSRNKGKRVEYELRDLLRAEGFQAERVPLSGSSNAFKGDVRFIDLSGKTYLAEVKARGGKVFDFVYNTYQDIIDANAVGIQLNTDDSNVVRITSNARDALNSDGVYVEYVDFKGMDMVPHPYIKRFNKIKEFVKGCDLLVIKADRKPFLFLRYI